MACEFRFQISINKIFEISKGKICVIFALSCVKLNKRKKESELKIGMKVSAIDCVIFLPLFWWTTQLLDVGVSASFDYNSNRTSNKCSLDREIALCSYRSRIVTHTNVLRPSSIQCQCTPFRWCWWCCPSPAFSFLLGMFVCCFLALALLVCLRDQHENEKNEKHEKYWKPVIMLKNKKIILTNFSARIILSI